MIMTGNREKNLKVGTGMGTQRWRQTGRDTKWNQLVPVPTANKTLPQALTQFLGASCLPRSWPACPGTTLQMHDQVVHGQDLATPQAAPQRTTANLQQQMVLEDALNRFQQEALQRQRVVELGLALLQPQGRWRRQRQLPEQGQGAGGTAWVRGASSSGGRGWEESGSGQGLGMARGWQGSETG